MTIDRPIVVAALVVALAFVSSVPASAADWSQWRGERRDGRSPDTGLLTTWPEGGPPLAWTLSGIGTGYSTVAVAGKRIYTLGDFGDAQYVLALRRNGGGIVWKARIGPAWDDKYLGPRSTPTVVGSRVYVLGTEGDLYCLKAKDGATIWHRNIAREFGGRMMKAKGEWDWKFSESPLVDRGRVIVTPGAPDAALVALDAKSGTTLWRTTLPSFGERGEDGAGYASAVVSEAGGVRQYVQLLGRGLVGVDATSGRFLWGYDRVANEIANIPTPLVDGDLVFASSGYGTGAALVELVRDDDGAFEARERYFLDPETFQNHHGGMILHDGHVYSGTGHNKGFPIAVRLADGQVVWGPERNRGAGSAAVAYADGRLYFRYQDGRMILVDATPDGYRERGSFEIPDVAQFSWPHPVVVDGRLYLREQDMLYVYDVRAR